MSGRGGAEATAPCSVELAVGPGAARVAVAIDRRAWARVELGAGGVEVFARDTVEKVAAPSVEELDRGGRMPLVARVLAAAGIESGLTVETRSRLPEGSGLGESSALAVALAAAVLEARGRPVDAQAVAAVLGSDARLEPAAVAAALHGGTVVASRGAGALEARPLDVDPARVEESLLLVDSGSTRTPSEGSVAPEEPGGSTMVGEALVAGRFEDAVALLAEQWTARVRRRPTLSTAEIDRVVTLARGAGGAAWACGPGPGGLVAIWAPPGGRGAGPREAVEAALAAAGLRPFPARVDLLGLDRASSGYNQGFGKVKKG